MTRRLIRFGHTVVAVEADDARAQALADFLFRFTGDGSGEPYTTFRVATDAASGRLAAYRDGVLIHRDASEAALAESLLGEVTFCLLDQSCDGTTLHAGAPAWRDQGVLIPGAIGMGKTTLTAWLTHRGLDYLTDELVWIPNDTNILHAFTRPLNVKKSARPVLHTLLDYDAHAAQVLRGDELDLILPTALRSTNRLSTPNLGLILFPNYQPDGDPGIERLSPAQAGLGLVPAILNSGSLGDQGFSQIARLARAAPAYRVRYSHFAQIERRLEGLLGLE
jgi:hypothetical protein